MRIGILVPGFSSDEEDWAIPVQLTLVREMARSDDVRVIALRYPHRRDSYTIYGAEVHSVGGAQVRGAGRIKLWLDTILLLRRLHRERPFDVLHAMWADETGLVAAWAGKWLSIPVVVSIAGGELVGIEDIGYGLQRSAFSRWIVGQALRGANRVITACAYTRHLIGKVGYNIADERIHTITLGVDIDLFRPAQSINTANTKQLVHVASLVGVKDQATLLRAMARLDDDVTLDILGSGPEEGRLKALAATLGIETRIRFAGSVQHLELHRHFQEAALNVLTSRHEGLGMVTLEAAACGIPTVGTAVGLLPDYPALGVSVAVGDEAAVANAISELLGDATKLQALGHSASELARTKFTIAETVRAFRELYNNLRSGTT